MGKAAWKKEYAETLPSIGLMATYSWQTSYVRQYEI